MSFVFFDIETTGLKPGFDQIMQFAAIRTDHQLNEIERFEVRSRLDPNVVPHPAAIVTNGLTIHDITNNQLATQSAMMSQIRTKLLAWSPAIFLGYNSIKFDEEMLRNAFFQTLYPPYLTSCHNNGRTDVFALALAAAAISDDCLIIPINADGKPTFKLEYLATANNINVVDVHNAIADTEAALEISRLVRTRSPELWQRFIRFSNKASVADFVTTEPEFLLSEFFGNQGYHTPVVHLGHDPEQNNAILCLSLTADVANLASATDDELAALMAERPCPIRKVKTNAAPVLTPIWEAPSEVVKPFDLNEIEERARFIEDNEVIRQRLISAYLSGRKPFPPAKSLEQSLYDGFASREDEARLVSFHQADWANRLTVIQALEDERLREFGLRQIYFQDRGLLTAKLRQHVEDGIAERLSNPNLGGLTLEQSLTETNEMLLRQDLSSHQTNTLQDFRTFLTHKINRLLAYREGRSAA